MRTLGEPTGSRNGRQAAFAASRTILVLAPDPHRCGELVGALQRRGLPSVQATTLEEAMYWAEEKGEDWRKNWINFERPEKKFHRAV